MRITFNEVAIRATRYYTDESGKRRQQTKKFWQTINPFNRNADGSVKTREQIVAELEVERAAWLKEPKP